GGVHVESERQPTRFCAGARVLDPSDAYCGIELAYLASLRPRRMAFVLGASFRARRRAGPSSADRKAVRWRTLASHPHRPTRCFNETQRTATSPQRPLPLPRLRWPLRLERDRRRPGPLFFLRSNSRSRLGIDTSEHQRNCPCFGLGSFARWKTDRRALGKRKASIDRSGDASVK